MYCIYNIIYVPYVEWKRYSIVYSELFIESIVNTYEMQNSYVLPH